MESLRLIIILLVLLFHVVACKESNSYVDSSHANDLDAQDLNIGDINALQDIENKDIEVQEDDAVDVNYLEIGISFDIPEDIDVEIYDEDIVRNRNGDTINECTSEPLMNVSITGTLDRYIIFEESYVYTDSYENTLLIHSENIDSSVTIRISTTYLVDIRINEIRNLIDEGMYRFSMIQCLDGEIVFIHDEHGVLVFEGGNIMCNCRGNGCVNKSFSLSEDTFFCPIENENGCEYDFFYKKVMPGDNYILLDEKNMSREGLNYIYNIGSAGYIKSSCGGGTDNYSGSYFLIKTTSLEAP